MSQKFWGRIYVTKIPKEKVETDDKGNKFINVHIWHNDKPDQYGNTVTVQLATKQGEDKVYLGNFKPDTPKQNAAPAAAQDDTDLPF